LKKCNFMGGVLHMDLESGKSSPPQKAYIRGDNRT
jgi:hypothetical protein